jgi:hypothetical protein
VNLLFIRDWVYKNVPKEWTEAILSGLRAALWVALGFLADFLLAYFTKQPQTEIVPLIVIVLTVLDKKIHEAQKERTSKTILQTGLAGF